MSDRAEKTLREEKLSASATKAPAMPSEGAAPVEGTQAQQAREISTKEAYFASLNEWVKHANISQNAMALFPWYLLSSYPQIFQSQAGMHMPSPLGTGMMTPSGFAGSPNIPQTPNVGANLNASAANANVAPILRLGGFRVLDDQQQAEIINRNGGIEFALAPFWKRAIAEFIDVLILLLLKIIVTFTFMNLFDLDLGFDLNKDVLRRAIEEEDYAGFLAVSMDFLAFSSDLLLLEVLTKVLVCFYEAIWTTLNGGSTPGKSIMGLHIKYVEAVVPLQPQMPQFQLQPPLGFQVQRAPMTAIIYPAHVPSFQRAFMRAVAKNLIMTLLFPMCFIMIFFKNNRTAYDIITKTVVVEDSLSPVFRPGTQQ